MNYSKLAFNTNDAAYFYLTPVGCINAMFEHTDADGSLYIPEGPYDDDSENERFYALKMNWNKEDRKKVISDFENLVSAIKIIAPVYDQLGDYTKENSAILSDELLQVWNTYIRDFDTGNIDKYLIQSVTARKAALGFADPFSNTPAVSAEAEVLPNIDIDFCYDEEVLYNEYKEMIHKDAEARLDNKIAAYDVIIRARRLCELMSLNAHNILINNEAKLLAQAMVVNRYALRMEVIELN